MFLSFIPIYMPKIKVKYLSIREILTIKEYWNLIGREQLLAITWEQDFSQACSFRRMLMNHNNFRLTQIPDKTNGMIFSHFSLIGIFSKKSGSVTHNYIWAPNTILISEQTNEAILRKVTNRWKDRRTDAAYFIGPFQLWLGVQQRNLRADWKLRGFHTIFVPKWPNCSE